MRLFVDIETVPTQRVDVIAAIRAEVESEAEAKAESIRRQYVKPETVEKHLAELRASVPSLIDAAHRRTALDGGFGEVLAIGWAIEDQPAKTRIRRLDEPEADLLRAFFAELPAPTLTALRWIGHNIVNFDLRFLWQRCLVLGIRPPVPIPLEDSREGLVFDTMLAWAGRWNRDKWPSLDELCRVFALPSPKGDLDGSQVWSHAQAGRYEEIAEYCLRDVEAVRQVFLAINTVVCAA
jgi:3'-5' exonuclease